MQRSQSVPPSSRNKSRTDRPESAQTDTPQARLQTSITPSASGLSSSRPKSTAKLTDDFLCVNCTNKSLIDDKRNRAQRQAQETLALEQRQIQELAAKTQQDRERMFLQKRAIADEMQAYLKSENRQKLGKSQELGGGSIFPEGPGKDFLKEQRMYREALLQQITQERKLKVEKSEAEKRLEMEGLKRAREAYERSASTVANAVLSQQEALRCSLLSQMNAKATEKDLEKSRKSAELQYLQAETARYQQIQRQRQASRKQQISDMMTSLRQQFRTKKQPEPPSGTSLEMSKPRGNLFPCSSCSRLLTRGYLTPKRRLFGPY